MNNMIKPTAPLARPTHQHRFKCTSCGTTLFGNKDLVDHTYDAMLSMSSSSLSINNMQSSQISISGNKSQLTKCACLFLTLTDWMVKQGVKQNPSGFLLCPNSVC